MRNILRLTLAIAALTLASSAPAQQKNVDAKKEKAGEAKAAGDADAAHRNKIAMCIGCHGIPGYKTAFPEVYHVPKIAGQQPGYIVAALKAYKSGDRSHPSMRG